MVVAEGRHQLAFWPQHAVLDGVEGIQDLEDTPVLLPNRVANALERDPALLEPSTRFFDRRPRRVAPGSRLPGARVALDPLKRVLGVAPAFPLDERLDVHRAQTLE